MTLHAPEQHPNQKDIRRDNRNYERTELHILERCTPGYLYSAGPDDRWTQTVIQIMEAEGYLIKVGNDYAISAKGRQYRNYLRCGSLRRWFYDNW